MRRLAISLVVALLLPSALSATRITILTNDPPLTGFNDPTPAEPVGGNSGTTRGEQRLIAFRHAAAIWEELLDSDVEIIVRAQFSLPENSTPCTETSATLGAAGPSRRVSNFANAPRRDVLYPIALANKYAGRDLLPPIPDIEAFFNADLDNATCLGTRKWYYGLDAKSGDDVDLVVVLLHELGHGLGMSGSLNVTTGEFSEGLPSVFEINTLDLASGLHFDQLTAEQRKAAVISGNQTVWSGPSTHDAAGRTLDAMAVLTISEPQAVAGVYEINPAAFGPRVESRPVAGRIAAALDEADTAGPATTDGCSAYTNPAEIAGRVALVDRGSCTFVEKALRAQAAGALGIIVVNNAECGLPPMGGASSAVGIPAVGIAKADGDAIRQSLAQGAVDGALHINPSLRSGTSTAGYVRLYVPCALSRGSSMYHWDISTSPNLLMEPFINDDLPHGVDVTIQQMLDIGWTQPPLLPDESPGGRRVLRRGR
ncbi:MAG TPA: PA domain-containing protein [Thermoanaerobaculia bacterium]|nr:PA domain-containing protein [Thermoanaerobaculia bacterium]